MLINNLSVAKFCKCLPSTHFFNQYCLFSSFFDIIVHLLIKMGVRGLQSYIERNCSEAFVQVSIAQMTHEHRQRYNCQPAIAVDGMSLIHYIYENDLEWVFGGQWLQFVDRLDTFVKRFASIGVDLVIFFDGTVADEKRSVWVKRRVESYKKISDIFQDIRMNHEPSKELFQLPVSVGTLSRFAMKELGVLVYQTVRDADQDIAQYAAHHDNVFAILSRDSDFIIYDTKPYLSFSCLDLDSCETKLYDRNYFASNFLQLHVYQLPLFACLLGNDIVSRDELRYFHRRITSNSPLYISNFAPRVANYINFKGWTGDINNERELCDISIEVFHNESRVQSIREGLLAYSMTLAEPHPSPCVNISHALHTKIFHQHTHCNNTPVIFNLMYKLQYESSQKLEDEGYHPSSLIFQPIRQRCYGLLFSCFSVPNDAVPTRKTCDNQDIIIKEWCAYIGNDMRQPEDIRPLPLNYFTSFSRGRIPSLEQIHQLSKEEKMPYFWSVLEPPMNLNLLFGIPKHLIILCCIVNYLIGPFDKQPLIDPWEVAVFIAQAIRRKDVRLLESIEVPFMDERGVYLSSVFMNGITNALTALGICDYPFDFECAMPWRYFDGKFFHYLYVNTKQRPSVYYLCDRQEDTLKEFYHLLPIVTSNTAFAVDKMDWKRYFPDFQADRIVIHQ